MAVVDDFEIAGGSITGREHLRAGKNNQDAFYWSAIGPIIVAGVCDGCSSGMRSETGANLGVRLIVEMMTDRLLRFSKPSAHLNEQALWERIRHDVLAQLRVLANGMGGSLSQTVNDFFLFTIVGAVLTDESAYLFSIGDGVFYLNGEMIRIGPFPGNEPPYLGYGLVGSTLAESQPELLKFQVHRAVPIGDVSSILVGSDGVVDLANVFERNMPGKVEPVGSISQFWQSDGYFSNPDKIRRKLTLVNTDSVKMREGSLVKEPSLLPDDTTLVVIRRKPKT